LLEAPQHRWSQRAGVRGVADRQLIPSGSEQLGVTPSRTRRCSIPRTKSSERLPRPWAAPSKPPAAARAVDPAPRARSWSSTCSGRSGWHNTQRRPPEPRGRRGGRHPTRCKPTPQLRALRTSVGTMVRAATDTTACTGTAPAQARPRDRSSATQLSTHRRSAWVRAAISAASLARRAEPMRTKPGGWPSPLPEPGGPLTYECGWRGGGRSF
jgi:hypothetical protein